MSDIVETHERIISAPIDTAARLIDEVAEPEGDLWPSPPWWPLRLDRPLAVGARGGHGPVRYHVSAYDAGRRVRFDLDRVLGVPVGGFHQLELANVDDDRCRLRHQLHIVGSLRSYLLWYPIARPLHRLMIKALMDRAERIAGEA